MHLNTIEICYQFGSSGLGLEGLPHEWEVLGFILVCIIEKNVQKLVPEMHTCLFLAHLSTKCSSELL